MDRQGAMHTSSRLTCTTASSISIRRRTHRRTRSRLRTTPHTTTTTTLTTTITTTTLTTTPISTTRPRPRRWSRLAEALAASVPAASAVAPPVRRHSSICRYLHPVPRSLLTRPFTYEKHVLVQWIKFKGSVLYPLTTNQKINRVFAVICNLRNPISIPIFFTC